MYLYACLPTCLLTFLLRASVSPPNLDSKRALTRFPPLNEVNTALFQSAIAVKVRLPTRTSKHDRINSIHMGNRPTIAGPWVLMEQVTHESTRLGCGRNHRHNRSYPCRLIHIPSTTPCLLIPSFRRTPLTNHLRNPQTLRPTLLLIVWSQSAIMPTSLSAQGRTVANNHDHPR